MIEATARWERFDAASPAPSFFARPAFARALSVTWPHLEALPFTATLEGNAYVLPLVRSRGRLGLRTAAAFPLGGYSCVLDELGGVAGAAEAAAVLERAARSFDRVDVEPWPLGAQPVLAHAAQSLRTTAVIACADGVRGSARRTAGQAERRGVRCRRSAADDASLRRYYGMLEEAARRWERGTPSIPYRLLEAVFAFGADGAELWFAELEGECIAGCVALFGREELFVWSAAMRRDYAAYRPSNALNVRLLERACERGMRWYNLGSSDGLHGVEQFKHSLGAREVRYAALHLRSPAARAYAHVRAVLHGEFRR